MFKCFFVLVNLFCLTSLALADAEDRDVSLVVRMIKASGVMEKNRDHHSAPEIDARLDDIKINLEQLPYRKFSFISTIEVPVAMRKRKTIRLPGANVLDVRLLYIDKDKTGMWVQWSDKEGSEVLDSRLHFYSGESVVVGTDATDDAAYILALGIK